MLFSPICGSVQLSSVIVIKIHRRETLCTQEKSKPLHLPVTLVRCKIWAGKKSQADSQKWPEILLRREGLQQRRQLLPFLVLAPREGTIQRWHWEVNESYWVSKARGNPEGQDIILSAREIFRTKVSKAIISPDPGPKLPPHQPILLWKTCAISHCNTSLPLELVFRQNQYCIEFSLTFGWNVHASGSSEKMAVISLFYRCPYLSLHSQAWPWKLVIITATIPSPGGN